MRLGKIKLKENNNIKKLSILFIKDCKRYINGYLRSRKCTDNVKRLKLIEEFINNNYKININIKNLLFTITSYIKIGVDGTLYLSEGYIKEIPVDILYKTITCGNLSIRGVSIITDSLKFAILKYNWRLYNVR